MWLADPQAEPMCTVEAFTERTGTENVYRRRVAGYISSKTAVCGGTLDTWPRALYIRLCVCVCICNSPHIPRQQAYKNVLLGGGRKRRYAQGC